MATIRVAEGLLYGWVGTADPTTAAHLLRLVCSSLPDGPAQRSLRRIAQLSKLPYTQARSLAAGVVVDDVAVS